jgi:hypothetical protein
MNWNSVYELLDLDVGLKTSQLLREHVPDALRHLAVRRESLVAAIKGRHATTGEGNAFPGVPESQTTETNEGSTMKYRATRPFDGHKEPTEVPIVGAEGGCHWCGCPWQLEDYWRFTGTKQEFMVIGFALDPDKGLVQLCSNCTQLMNSLDAMSDRRTAQEAMPRPDRPRLCECHRCSCCRCVYGCPHADVNWPW